jgi:hypothetical protein
MRFALCKEQEHSRKQGSFVVMINLKLLWVFRLAGLTVCIFLLVHFISFCSTSRAPTNELGSNSEKVLLSNDLSAGFVEWHDFMAHRNECVRAVCGP